MKVLSSSVFPLWRTVVKFNLSFQHMLMNVIPPTYNGNTNLALVNSYIIKGQQQAIYLTIP